MNILGKAGQLIQAGIRYAGDGFTNVNDAVYHKRLSVCSQCDKFDNFTCTECGCNLNLKARMRLEKCPLGKWLEETESVNSIEGSSAPACGGCGAK